MAQLSRAGPEASIWLRWMSWAPQILFANVELHVRAGLNDDVRQLSLGADLPHTQHSSSLLVFGHRRQNTNRRPPKQIMLL